MFHVFFINQIKLLALKSTAAANRRQRDIYYATRRRNDMSRRNLFFKKKSKAPFALLITFSKRCRAGVCVETRAMKFWNLEPFRKRCSQLVRLIPYLACSAFFLTGTVFFSHNNSIKIVFFLASFSQNSTSRTEPALKFKKFIIEYV